MPDSIISQVTDSFQRDPNQTPSTAKGRQILIIEDSPTLRGMVRRALQKGLPDAVIREADEGRQALSQMSQKKVDLIITDLEMPGMDGQAFLSLLKANPILMKKPVLVFSSNITPELRERAREMPNVRFLAKPADPEKIVQEASLLLGVKPA